MKFNITVLTDTTKSDKTGTLVTFIGVEQNDGIFSSRIATGYIKTMKELKKGDVLPKQADRIQVIPSSEPITIDGKEVYADWIAFIDK